MNTDEQRSFYAAAALSGLCACETSQSWTAEEFAACAFEIADAMMAPPQRGALLRIIAKLQPIAIASPLRLPGYDLLMFQVEAILANAPVAQRIEQPDSNGLVAGSIPAGCTNFQPD